MWGEFFSHINIMIERVLVPNFKAVDETKVELRIYPYGPQIGYVCV